MSGPFPTPTHAAQHWFDRCRETESALAVSRAETETLKDALRERTWRGVESLRGYQAVLGQPREGEDERAAKMRGRHFGAHIDSILDGLRDVLQAAGVPVAHDQPGRSHHAHGHDASCGICRPPVAHDPAEQT